MPPIAIDFGTTRTKVAYFDHDIREPRLIELGHEVRAVIPSIFYIPYKGPILVGDDAQRMIDEDPAGVVVGLKKDIHKLGKYRCGGGRPPVDRRELASNLFRHIREQCENEVFHGEKISECILTVPVAFEDQKRDCIREAARMGGFEKITLIEEPVAAARAWLAKPGQKVAPFVVVCDIGGGTTDFALLRFDRNRFEAIPEVPPFGFSIGGNDVDESILSHILDEEADNTDAVEQGRAGFLVRLRQVRESFARTPQRQEMGISLNGAALKIPQNTVNSCAAEFVNRVADELKRFLTRCQAIPQVKDPPILLVGGGSRMPGLKSAIETIAPGRVFQWNQSDYAIVLGAVEFLRDSTSQTDIFSIDNSKVTLASPKSSSNLGKESAKGNTEDIVNSVRALIGDGKIEKAFDVTTNAFASSPNKELLDLWATCSISMIDNDKVTATARDIHDKRRGDLWSSACLAYWLATLGRHLEAKNLLYPFLESGQGTDFAFQYAHFANLAETEEKASNLILGELLKKLPNSPNLLVAKAAQMNGQPDLQKETLEKAFHIDPNNLAVLLSQALNNLSTDNSPEFCANQVGEKLRHMERISPSHYMTIFVKALYSAISNQFYAAIEHLNQIENCPQVKNSKDLLCSLLNLRVRAYQQLEKLPEECRDLEELIRLKPMDLDFRGLRADLYLRQGKHPEAEADSDFVLNNNQDSFGALMIRGWARYYQGGRGWLAAKDFENAYRLQPGNIQAKFGATCSIIAFYLSNLNVQGFQFKNCFLFPQIPDDKLKNAIKSYVGQQIAENSGVALLFDDTFFGGAKDGFCITEDRFLGHNLWQTDVLSIELSKIKKVSFKRSDLYVNGYRIGCSQISTNHLKEVLNCFIELLNELAEMHRRFESYQK